MLQDVRREEVIKGGIVGRIRQRGQYLLSAYPVPALG